jgi:pimeloyl-ACP methyl ester carboxylesterase
MVQTRAYLAGEYMTRFGIEKTDIKFDIVAHSMGGLVTRYVARYGDDPLPDEGEVPTPNWKGSELIENVILVGTPNAGSAEVIRQLVEGFKPASILPRYSAAILGTMPALYQLLPRGRHGPLEGVPGKDLLDPETWKELAWGLASPEQDHVLQKLLPDVQSAEERRRIGIDHLEKCLRRAKRFHTALDYPARAPAGMGFYLFAGDAVPTTWTLVVNEKTGAIRVGKEAAGDGTVLRSSALMDERVGQEEWSPRLISPIEWRSVHLLFTDHIGLTQDPAFTDNVLHILLERPRQPVNRGP